MSELRNWLETQGLERYAEALLAQDIDLDVLPALTDADLTAAGLPIGARKRLLQAIEGLRKGPDKLSINPQHPTIVPSEAERRQLTVLFCDVVGSTTLAEKLDAEDLRSLLLSFQKVCADVVQRNEGQIGLFIGDGVTAYFGYPRDHEDSAQRAVQTGLDIMSGLAELGIIDLEARCGVHTGPVVVGEMGIGEKRLSDGIVGEAPNIAARLQSLAPPGGLVLSEATLRLVRGYFDIEPLGPQVLKGVTLPITTYRVVRAKPAADRFEARSGQTLTALVGRETELGFLLKRWENAEDGEGQAVLLQGEAGIGKSRMLKTFRTHIHGRPHSEVVFYCSPQYQTSALWPVMQQMRQALSFSDDDDPARRLELLRKFLRDIRMRSAEDVAVALSAFLDLALDSEQTTEDPEQARRSLFAALLRIISSMADRDPVLLIVEDAHWLDPSTAELVGQALSGIGHQRLFVLITARPEFRPPWSNYQLVTLPLTRLSRRETEAMIRNVAPPDFSETMLAQLASKADGVPLFIEELIKSVTESKTELDFSGPIEIPASLQAALHTRLDRLAPIRQIIQVAALLGRVFDADLLFEVSQRGAPAGRQALQELTEAELIYPVKDPYRESYEFKHALIQDAAVSTLLRNQKAQIHRKIALALIKLRPDVAGQRPELLAHHLQEAGDWNGALDHWQKAGAVAMARAATREAVSHFSNAITAAKSFKIIDGGTERIARLHLAMATALMQCEGYRSERLGNTLESAHLAATTTNAPELQCEIVLASAPHAYATGRNHAYLKLADEQLNNALNVQPDFLSGLWSTKGIAYYNRGEFSLAVRAFDKARELFEPIGPTQRCLIGGGDQRIVTMLYLERTLTIMGLLELCINENKRYLNLIGRPVKPFDIAWMGLSTCHLASVAGDYDLLRASSAEIIEICERHGFTARRGNGLIQHGIALSKSGQLDAGIREVREGLAIWRSHGGIFHTAERTSDLCALLIQTGQFEEAANLLDEADALIAGTDEACFQAEFFRLRGQVAIGMGRLDAALRLFEEAITLAHRQEAGLFELRATTQLAGVLAKLERSEEGKERLGAIISAFNTDHEVTDLVAARNVLSSTAF
jgi:class 3 adenylate cyclase/tetratricopeptide (TPR) repeat protein